jgi:hypothetical protein
VHIPNGHNGMVVAKKSVYSMGSLNKKHYAMSRRELLELLGTTRGDDTPSRRTQSPGDPRPSGRGVPRRAPAEADAPLADSPAPELP